MKAWSALRRSGPTFFVIGHCDAIAAAFPPGSVAVERIASPEQALGVFGQSLPVLEPAPTRNTLAASSEVARSAAIIEWIEAAVGFAVDRSASGIVTAPISKAVLYQGGFRFPGHTEFLAELTRSVPMAGERGPVMMLAARDLRVSLVTIHEPLSAVSQAVTRDRVIRTARVTHQALVRDFAIQSPRLALAGLNPHAGEGGAIGREEIDVLEPAIATLLAEGIDISAPRPADTLFHEEARRGYDAAICLYHDQALIPIKTLDFWGAVNVTLGLPIVRASPDHGTGFDIAGKGIARPDSLIAALRMASEVAARRAVTPESP